jgi:O-acetyl-ADP-ribose deacetylase
MIKEYIVPRVIVKRGSITTIQVDGIVNPANSFGYMGGGVAKAIKDIGGQVIEDEAIACAPIQVGDAAITTAGDLVAKKVIHAPTMHEPVEKTDSFKVESALEAALDAAENDGMRSIAIPGMGTGVGGLSRKEAAKTMVGVIKRRKYESLELIILVAHSEEMAECFEKELRSYEGKKK